MLVVELKTNNSGEWKREGSTENHALNTNSTSQHNLEGDTYMGRKIF